MSVKKLVGSINSFFYKVREKDEQRWSDVLVTKSSRLVEYCIVLIALCLPGRLDRSIDCIPNSDFGNIVGLLRVKFVHICAASWVFPASLSFNDSYHYSVVIRTAVVDLGDNVGMTRADPFKQGTITISWTRLSNSLEKAFWTIRDGHRTYLLFTQTNLIRSL